MNTSARLFRQHGYAAVTLRSIAEAAGIKAASIYYHFPSKDVIVLEVLDAGILAVEKAVRNAVNAKTADSPLFLRAAIHAHLQALLAHGDYTSANVRIFGQVPAPVRQSSLPVRHAYEQFWDEMLSELQRAGVICREVNIPTLRLMIIGALNATLEWFDPARGHIDDLADQYTYIFLNGISFQKDEQ